MGTPRKDPTQSGMDVTKDSPAHVGNYSQGATPTGEYALDSTLFGTKMDKTESAFVAGAKNKGTATQAVKNARRANKQPPLKED